MSKDKEAKYRFLLFVAMGQKNSDNAERNIHEFLEKHLKGRYELKIIDVTKEPKLALKKGVYLTPMLITTLPLPETYLAGDMSDEEQLKNTILK